MTKNMVRQIGNIRAMGEDNGHLKPPQAVRAVPESLVQALWRNRWMVLVTMTVSLVVGFVYVAKSPPVYTSTSRIYVEQSGPKILTEAEGVMTQSKNYLYTQAELLKSTPILTAALEKIDTRRLKTFERVDNPMIFLKKQALDVSVGKKDDIISISCDASVPTEAEELVNAVVESYIHYQNDHKRTTAADVLKILRKEKQAREKDLANKLKALMDFRCENVALAYEHGGNNTIMDALERLLAKKTEAQLQTIEANSVYETAKSLLADPTGLEQYIEMEGAKGVRVSIGDERNEIQTKLEQLEDELADLKSRAKADHPWVESLQQKVDRARNQLAEIDAEFLQRHVTVAKRQYEAAKKEEKQIGYLLEEQNQQVIQLSRQLSEYTILQSDWEEAKKDCASLDERMKEVSITEDAGCLNICILEVARAPMRPSGPQKAKYMATASFFGFVLSVGLALLRDQMDQRLRSLEDASAVLDMPVLGAMPAMSRKHSVVSMGQKVYLDPKSSWAEACRTVRTAVFFGAPREKAKTILVTSPTPGDGKSTLASNLAIAIAQAGQKTLILDADFRKAMQHKIFDVNRQEVGLSTILAGITTSAEAIQQTSIEGLDLLPCGADVPNPSELLNSDVFAQLLEILSDRYERIIIDSPPVMLITDARILAALCHITILVVRVDKSTRKTSRHARDGLLGIGANILGVVVNDVPRDGQHGYYGTYGYHYGDNGSDRDHPKKKEASQREPMAATTLSQADRFSGSRV
jgi:succinoglycan biosynthesis transport protein ExoP